METGGLAGAVFNGAKEVAMDAFLARRIGFLDMARVVEATLAKMSGERLGSAQITLDSVTGADHLARKRAEEAISAIESIEA